MRVLTVFGTRPEAIKLAPVLRALNDNASVTSRVCVTAQHREMLDQVLSLFGIQPDHDLNVMKPGQSLSGLTARLLLGLDSVFESEKPDFVLVQGDTTTAFVAALAAFYRKIPVGHLEAGLRTGNMYSPFPEEINRQAISRLASLHFAPTSVNRNTLLEEGVRPESICVTGNTVIDALLWVTDRLKNDPELAKPIQGRFSELDPNRRLLLVTAHRRESFGAPMRQICESIAELATRSDVQVVFPVHRNPRVVETVHGLLSGRPNVTLTEPLDYLTFAFLMTRAYVLLSDSGGVQEEAPALGKPVLVMREMTERTEAVAAGTIRIVGTTRDRIVAETLSLLTDPAAYDRMATAINPYGDGTAAERVVDALLSTRRPDPQLRVSEDDRS